MADKASGPAGARTRTYNLVTAVILALTIVVCLLGIYLTVALGGRARAQEADEPAAAGDATATPTVAAPTPNATLTGTSIPTATATPTVTPTPTITPTNLPTLTMVPTDTPTATPTPTSTSTPVPTNTPAATATNTRAPFDYVLRGGSVTYRDNFANSAGCDWLGIAGQVFDLNGQPQTGLMVHVSGGGVDQRVRTGDYPAYGQSGWEIYLDNHPKAGTFTVRLETAGGQPLSDAITVETGTTCEHNLALLAFDQVQ